MDSSLSLPKINMNRYQECSGAGIASKTEKPAEFDARMRARLRRNRKGNCKLNADDSLSLQDILHCFNSPISREQAWALCHQTAKSLSYLPRNDLRELTDASQILLHKDGHIFIDFPKGCLSAT